MTKSSLRTLGSFAAAFCLGAVLLGAVGCAENITYSKDSRREGLRLMDERQYADAAGAFRNAVRQNPSDYRSYYYLGQAYEKLGQHQQALQSYKSARDVIMLTVDGREDEQMQYQILDSLAGAIASSPNASAETDWAENQAHARQQAKDWYLVARIHVARGDLDSAIDAWNRAVLADPRNFPVSKAAGLYFERIGQSDRAETVLRRAYVLDPTDMEVDAALRRLGIIPGPSLQSQDRLAKPVIPLGPIPELEIRRAGSASSRTPAASPSSANVQAPRD